MYNGMNMMDPELMRLAQEQMSRIPKEELARIQQQMVSNPELVRLATESMKNLRPEDMRRAAEQLKYTKPEDMVEISEKMAKATPEEIAAMKARADAQVSYELSAAQMLKQQGNQLHSRGQFHDAANKYLLAKNNLKGIPSSKCGTLQLQCSLNLMSCYLKTRQFEDCIKEGSEVLTYDSKNIKALYRRGQAYKELGKLKAAVADLSKAHEYSPEDETIADVLRDANEKLMEGGDMDTAGRLVIEEIEEDDSEPTPSASHRSSSAEYSVSQPFEAGESSKNGNQSHSGTSTADIECVQNFADNPEAMRLFQNYISNANPETLAAMGAGGMSPDMVRMATEMLSKMKPEGLQKMLQVASSLNGKGPTFPMMSADTNGGGSSFGSQLPEMSPEMVKMASDTIGKMSPEELQKMFEVATSVSGNSRHFPMAAADGSTQSSFSGTQSSTTAGSSTTGFPDAEESNSGRYTSGPGMVQPPSSIPSSTADLQAGLRNSMNDPAMRQMFTSMMKNMSPEMMANMSEQFGVKLSREDAVKAQQAMSSLSPDALDKMLKWVDRAQRGVETARRTKNWLLGRPGMILAICMLILAIILHRLGFIGG